MTKFISKRITTISSMIGRPGGGMVIFLVFISIAMSFISPFFMTWLNWANILNQSIFYMLVGTGMTLVLIAGGLDLSVGAVVALVGAFVGWLMSAAGFPLLLAIVCGLSLGAMLGLLNGLVVTKLGLSGFVTTLATMTLFRGALFVWTGGVPISGYSTDAYSTLGGLNRIAWNLTVPEFIVAALVVVVTGFLSYHKFGSHLRSVGENSEMARVSGVNATYLTIGAYVASACFAALVGVLMAGRLGQVQPNMARGLEIYALAAAIMGGASLSGGRGSVTGAVLGGLTLTVIENAINLAGIPPIFETTVVGLIILTVIGMNRVSTALITGNRRVGGTLAKF